MAARILRRRFVCLCFLALAMDCAHADNAFTISSPAFQHGMPIPIQYGYDEQNISPELRIANIPAHARSLALIVDDPDSPSGLWTHWLVWNVASNITEIPEGKLPPDAREGKNSFGNVRYDGPAPPQGTHRYFFRLYALDTTISLPRGADRSALEQALNGHILTETETFGTYRMALTEMP
jgi:Raf kinase inhibitor-like YbhB/YbcL family protein